MKHTMVEYKQRWIKHSEDPDGTVYYEDPKTGKVYWESLKAGWIEA